MRLLRDHEVPDHADILSCSAADVEPIDPDLDIRQNLYLDIEQFTGERDVVSFMEFRLVL